MGVLKKSILAAIGAVALTAKEAEKIVDQLIKEGELVKSERAEAVKELMEKAERRSKELKEKIDSKVKEALNNLRGIPRKDVEDLRVKLSRLEEKVDKLVKDLGDKIR